MRQSVSNGFSYTAAFLGGMAALSVLAFHFPQYLTTPQLREVYGESQLRLLLATGMGVALLCGLLGLSLGGRKRYAVLGLALTILAWLAGGPFVPLDGPVRSARFYISLDWLLLDLFLIATLFIAIERTHRLRDTQTILRSGWRLDLTHYVVNHLFNGGMIYLIYLPATVLRNLLGMGDVPGVVSNWHLAVQVLLIMAVTDLAQYWVHRASHRVPLLWRFHKVHHSVEVMDWLAGSRLHIIDILVTRSLVLIPMVLLGFSNEAVNIYLPILALQSVFIHCNVDYPIGWLRKILAIPQFHHWHHTRDPNHRDRNFSVTLPVYDLLFGTYYCPRGRWPDDYGLDRPEFEQSYYSHLVLPFRRDKA